ncbi:PASTA domain-containing protein [Salinicoccus sp. CNSTN-B1]
MPGFNPLMERTLKYLTVGEEDGESPEPVKIEDYTGKMISDVPAAANDSIQTIILGEGEEVVDHYPKNDKLLPYETFFIKTDGQLKMPDLTGLSKREVIMFGDFAGMDVTVEGEGYVNGQSIDPGIVLEDGQELKVTLSSNDPED